MADDERTRRADAVAMPVCMRGRRASRFLLLVAAALLVTAPGVDAGRAGHYFSFDPDEAVMGKHSTETSAAHYNLVKAGPHLTLKDTGNVLENYENLKSGVTVEAWTCIRDRRALAPPRPTDNNGRGVSNPSQFWRIPIAGNMQHSQHQGYQLECGWNEAQQGPECCITAYMTCLAEGLSNAGQPEVAACVSLKHEPSGDPALKDASKCGAHQWVHLAGTVADGIASMVVTTANGTRISGVNQRVPQACASTKLSLATDLAFRVGGQIPYRDTGRLFPKDSTDSSGLGNTHYYFFRGDVDEVRVFAAIRSGADAAEAFELASGGAATCHLENQADALVVFSSMPRLPDELQTVVQNPTAVRGISATSLTGQVVLEDLDLTGSRQPLAYRVGVNQASALARAAGAPEFQCAFPPAENYFTDTDPCGQTYMDRAPAVLEGRGSVDVALSTGLTAPAEHAWRFRDGVYGKADVVIATNNYHNKLSFKSWLFGSSVVALDYPQNFPLVEDEWKYGLPFASVDVSYQSFKANKYALDNHIAEISGVESALLPPEVPRCRTNCKRVFMYWDVSHLNRHAQEDCYGEHNGTAYTHLCYEWWVPLGRGWRTLLKYSVQTPDCAPVMQESRDYKYASRIGYEATPEWFSRDEFPTVSAAGNTRVLTNYFSEAICPTPNERFEVMVGRAMPAITFRARDRNKDDAVDIRPLDDPGLPNGAVLIPPLVSDSGDILYARESDASTLDRPKIYDRVFAWTPEPSQHGKEYRVCFRATSRLAPIINSETLYTPFRLTDAQYREAVGDTISTRPEAPGQPSVWTDRCVEIAVVSPRAGFGCSRADPTMCTARNNSELDFTAGDAACSTTLELWAVDRRCDGLSRGECDPYDMQINVDPNFPGPDGFSVLRDDSNQAEVKYSATWLPQAGKDENEAGYRVCLIASDTFGISQERRCYVLRVRKCKYCWFDGETLESIGHQFGLDWLQIYMANPHIRTPDVLQPENKVINLGAVYQVRAGDYLTLLGQRFFMSEQQLRRLNPDIPESGAMRSGQRLCVMPPVCDVDCLYGTDCHVY